MEQKLNEEELKEINELQNSYNTLAARFGQTKIEKILAQAQLDKLNELEDELTRQYKILQDKEKYIVTKIETKYGVGEVDIQTGIFTPFTATV